MRAGHDWAYDCSCREDGWIMAICLRCNAEQMLFLDDGGTTHANLDDDSPEE